jgi:hypothetical protein
VGIRTAAKSHEARAASQTDTDKQALRETRRQEANRQLEEARPEPIRGHGQELTATHAVAPAFDAVDDLEVEPDSGRVKSVETDSGPRRARNMDWWMDWVRHF